MVTDSSWRVTSIAGVTADPARQTRRVANYLQNGQIDPAPTRFARSPCTWPRGLPALWQAPRFPARNLVGSRQRQSTGPAGRHGGDQVSATPAVNRPAHGRRARPGTLPRLPGACRAADADPAGTRRASWRPGGHPRGEAPRTTVLQEPSEDVGCAQCPCRLRGSAAAESAAQGSCRFLRRLTRRIPSGEPGRRPPGRHPAWPPTPPVSSPATSRSHRSGPAATGSRARA